MKRLALPTILLAASALLASGCVYKMNIQQGNYLVADSVSQLKEGMTRSQVRFLLGTPMVPDAFDDYRWDYYYFFSSRQIQEAAQAPPDRVFRRTKACSAIENQGVPTQTDLAAARARSAQGHRREQEERDKQSVVATHVRPRQAGAARLRRRRLRAATAARPRRRPIPCRLPAFARSRRDSFGSALSGR